MKLRTLLLTGLALTALAMPAAAAPFKIAFLAASSQNGYNQATYAGIQKAASELGVDVTIFDGAFRFTFTYILPIGFIAFYPSQIFLRPEDVSMLTYFSPIVGIGLFAFTYWVWKKGVNSYTGTGS